MKKVRRISFTRIRIVQTMWHPSRRFTVTGKRQSFLVSSLLKK